ncbi:unnamed protein product [Nippostrongylus brasiliensis]|uniref:DDE_Tnp_1_7 domain-containing protein n=1 Tax=Nippostrongylus brasiliensis TaxID=27835 RepID=A0A0N4YMM6_NIPBR|nr:unnamed protein product [Nippostrongylus brasiliensis]
MQGRCLYTDKWCTSLQLTHTLFKKKTDLVGAIRRNRNGIPQIVRDQMLQRDEFISMQNKTGVVALKWKDKMDIYTLSTKHDASEW